MKIAVYEPSPRICGPDTWADALRSGFRELGHECHVISFTGSGKAPPRWGRVERSKSSSMSCRLTVDRVAPVDLAGDILNEYDLVVLTDVKCPMHDNKALDEDEPYPQYVEVLSESHTPWTSALHGRWYYAADEAPAGLSERSGSPFIEELLGLDNFSGFLVRHADCFADYCRGLRAVRSTALSPLPYVLSENDGDVTRQRRDATLAVIGRMIPTKHRHVVNEALTRGLLPSWTAYYGGACSCTHGPSETYVMTEQLAERGWTHDWGDDGVRKTKPFTARLNDCEVQYLGAYQHPHEVLENARVHVGITDCDFSGGLLEFATLEAIDCGCVPVITAPFVPHARSEASCCVIPYGFKKFTPRIAREASDDLLRDVALTIEHAGKSWSPELIRHNRNCIARENDPRLLAKLFMEGAL